jgi:LysM repeat protein
MRTILGKAIISLAVFTAGFWIAGCAPMATRTVSPSAVAAVTLSPLPMRETGTPESNNGSIGTIVAPTPTALIYTVKKDDLGSYIALRYGVTLPMLQAANPNVDLNFLKEGSTLIIPAPVNTPSPILYTPTPVLADLGRVNCYPTIDQDLWCLVNVSNNQQNDLYFLTGQFRVGDGQKGYAVTVSGLADRIPVGQEIPLIGFIQGPVGYPFQAEFSLITSFAAEGAAVTALSVENQTVEIDPLGAWIKVSGELVNPGKALTYAAVVAAGYQGDSPAGVRKLEFPEGMAEGGRIPFTMFVYSTGPRMDRVVVLAEGK